MTTLQQMTDAEVHPEVKVNELVESLSAAGIFSKNHATTSAPGLTWGYYGGLYNGNAIADGTVTLTDAATNYVVVLRSSGVVSTSTSTTNGANPLYAQLYKITTAAGAVSAVVDQRMDSNGLLIGSPSTGGSGGTELKDLTFTSDTGSTADSDPGNGIFKWNNATEASATFLYFDNQTADGVSMTTFYASLGASGFIYLQQSDDSTKWQLWKWTAVTSASGYYKFAVTLQASGGSIADNKTVYCDFSGLGSATGASTTQTDEFISGYFSAPTAKTYKIVVKASHGGTITETTTISESGTGTATFKINTTALGGTANAVSSSEQSQAQASANVFSAGDDLQITMSSLSSLVGMSFTIKYTRTLA